MAQTGSDFRTRMKRGRGAEALESAGMMRWLLTYADMITLLVAFFIMLYAMSVMNQQKFQQLAISVRSGFGGSVTTGAPTIIQQGGGIEARPPSSPTAARASPAPARSSPTRRARAPWRRTASGWTGRSR